MNNGESPVTETILEIGATMNAMIEAPWTDEQVAALNWYQQEGPGHPFTGERHPDGRECVLIATKDGWVKQEGGPVVQTWAWDFMMKV